MIKAFSKTIDYYDKSRPSYPAELFNFLEKKFDADGAHVIADIGSGTGIFTKLLLDRGHHVISVEPNDEMRKIAEENLAHYPFYKSVAASAESTRLEESSVDMITAATAFHWFSPELAKCEFKRILKLGGICVLAWNVRDKTFPIMQDYESMMRHFVSDYEKVVGSHYSSEDVIIDFFNPNEIDTIELPNIQPLDLVGFQGRILSTSYSPKPGDSNYKELLIASEDLFNKYKSSNKVNLYYRCKCYAGKL